ncbi:hypothetical protein LTR15_007022 [Elasticomyces elasticus]|nr:hypothetical protein LTR15_007022 [Elasticomyces elasticus]
MPGLSNHAPRLLRKVNGKTHAGDEDHEPYDAKQLATAKSPSTASRSGSKQVKKVQDVDTDASPVSSDSEHTKENRAFLPPNKVEVTAFKVASQIHAPTVAAKSRAKPFQRPSRSSVTQQAPSNEKFRKLSAPGSPPSSGTKRSSEESERDSSDDDAVIWSSQQTETKRRRLARRQPNIHAPKRHSRSQVYGSQGQRARLRDVVEQREAEAKRVKEAEEVEKATRNAFKRVNVPAAFASQDNAASLFKVPDKRVSDDDAVLGADDDRNSIDLSDLSDAASSPPPEVVASFNLPSAVRRLECAVCGDSVTASQREDFEDRFEQAKSWNYKWQQRFCQYHKQTEASQLWVERGYPDIDWIRFESRLKHSRHIEHIERMISGEISSAFRKQFQKKVKSRAKTLLQAADDENAGISGSAGYYGPRGEKLMSDHITSSFADELRSHAIRDTLVASAGVSGGLSGFIQSVLVPELAVSLIREDLELQKRSLDPMKVLEDSAELGEIMHPEVEDQVRVGAHDEVESDA